MSTTYKLVVNKSSPIIFNNNSVHNYNKTLKRMIKWQLTELVELSSQALVSVAYRIPRSIHKVSTHLVTQPRNKNKPMKLPKIPQISETLCTTTNSNTSKPLKKRTFNKTIWIRESPENLRAVDHTKSMTTCSFKWVMNSSKRNMPSARSKFNRIYRPKKRINLLLLEGTR